jgi:uncharacterized protein
MDGQFQLIMKEGVHPSQVVGKKAPPPPDYVDTREGGLHIERNLQVALRDGVRIFVDLYRPDGAWPAAGVAEGWISQHTAFEAPDPSYWCARGYAVAYPDPRGSWYSEGELRHGGLGEAHDCHDLIEWLGTRPWCSGKVGMSGVSYLAAIQWLIAPLKPRHLAALYVCEGFSDWYREFALHGGIPETSFVPRGCANLQYSTTRTEDTAANVAAHPLYDAYWGSKESTLERIETPAYVVASWSDQGLHTRGTLEAFKRISSRHKWLEVHGRKKWHYYYEPSVVERQRQFFERFLKGADGAFTDRPAVSIEVRERANLGAFRAEREWPLARTQFQRLYLDPTRLQLLAAPPAAAGSVRHDATVGRTAFDHVFAQDTELTGHMSLRLWVEADGSDDMDLFVAVQKLDRTGAVVPFVFYAMLENGPVALGWLRASHRELDPRRSRPEQPFHTHLREQRLAPGERVVVEIEIWPSSTKFAAGEGLRVVIGGQDLYQEGLPMAPFARHEDTRNQGVHIIHAGGQYDSYLLAPVIPAEGRC